MLGDEPMGYVALGEGDFPAVNTPALPAVAEFSWSVETVALFGWSESTGTANFGWWE